MSRNLLQAHTDDTRVDLKRSTLADGDAPAAAAEVAPETMPEMTLPGGLGVDDDDEGDAETIMLSRLPWPEPPRSLADRMLAERRALTRTDDGLANSIISLRNDPRAVYWRLLGGAVIVMACASVLLPRPSAQPAAAPAVAAQAAAIATPRPAPQPLPPLIITVGTPVQPKPAADTATTKTTIDPMNLPPATTRAAAAPPAPKRVTTPAAPAPRTKPTPAAPRPKAKSAAKSSSEVVVDDGF